MDFSISILLITYNIIFAWDDLKKTAEENLEDARRDLTERISVYKIFKGCEIILVFDAYKVKGNRGEVEKFGGITIVYTKESQTADAYIEKAAKELTKNYNVTVATSDSMEQLIIFGSGAYRMTAKQLQQEVGEVEKGVRKFVEQYNIEPENSDFMKTLREKLREIED